LKAGYPLADVLPSFDLSASWCDVGRVMSLSLWMSGWQPWKVDRVGVSSAGDVVVMMICFLVI
jgi:hypothetical protein